MKRRKAASRKISLALALAVLCGGCGRGGSSGEEAALAMQKRLSHLTRAEGEVQLWAEYDTKSFSCVLEVEYDRETGGKLTIVEPELAEGIEIGVGENGLTISDGAFILDTGAILSDGTAPVESLGTLWHLARDGVLAETAVDAGTVTALFRSGESEPGVGLEGSVSFDAATGALESGELYEDGTRVVEIQFRDWTLETDLDE